MNEINLTLPNDFDKLSSLKCGDVVYLSGKIFTARDATHKRLIDIINRGEKLPFDLSSGAIYYAGPCPKDDAHVIGSIGPTSSYRMDKFTPTLLDNGLKVMIGKGERSEEVISSIKKNKAVYLVAVGGAGALYAKHVKSAKIIAFNDLISEAVYLLDVNSFPLIVGVDSYGNSVYK